MKPMLALALACLAGAARADVAVTVYNQDLAVVRETSPYDLKKGDFELRRSEVAAQIDPTSVSLKGPAGFSVLEQDYDYDLVSSQKMLQRYLGQHLTGFDKTGKPFEGTLLSADEGQMVMLDRNGAALMLNRAELKWIEFPEVPGGLLTKPTLTWKARAAKEGRENLTLTYMTSGFSWHAEYVATVASDEKTLDLNAWVSLDNRSGAAYSGAKLKLVAGDINRAPQPRVMEKRALMGMAAAAPMAEDGFAERQFFEYHLYDLGRPVDLRDQQVKQVELLSARAVPVKKVYTFDAQQDAKKVKVSLEMVNAKEAGLGMPLPAGKLRAFKADADGSLQLAGEDAVDHTPKDEKLRVNLGKSFDVVGERRVVSDTRVSDRVRETEVEVKLRNHRGEPVTVVVVDRAWGDWEVRRASLPHRKKDATTLEFDAEVAAGGETTLTYTVRSAR